MTNKRVLVIDDEDDIREIIQLSLEMVAGWEVLTACSGSAGLKIAREAQPDAILLDVMMPDMDGPATFQKIQSDPAIRDIPTILLTAKVQATDRRRFTDLRVKGALAKPFDPMLLAGQVAAILGWNS
jgi:CheY-like chemotaxis protein